MKQFLSEPDRVICLGGVYGCAAVVLWQATPIIGNAVVQALIPVLPLISLVFFSLLLLYLLIAMILSIVWMVGEVCELVDEWCYDLSWRTSGKWSDATQISGVPVECKICRLTISVPDFVPLHSSHSEI